MTEKDDLTVADIEAMVLAEKAKLRALPEAEKTKLRVLYPDYFNDLPEPQRNGEIDFIDWFNSLGK